MVATAPTYSVTCWGTFVMIVNAHLHIHKHMETRQRVFK